MAIVKVTLLFYHPTGQPTSNCSMPNISTKPGSTLSLSELSMVETRVFAHGPQRHPGTGYFDNSNLELFRNAKYECFLRRPNSPISLFRAEKRN